MTAITEAQYDAAYTSMHRKWLQDIKTGAREIQAVNTCMEAVIDRGEYLYQGFTEIQPSQTLSMIDAGIRFLHRKSCGREWGKGPGLTGVYAHSFIHDFMPYCVAGPWTDEKHVEVYAREYAPLGHRVGVGGHPKPERLPVGIVDPDVLIQGTHFHNGNPSWAMTRTDIDCYLLRVCVAFRVNPQNYGLNAIKLMASTKNLHTRSTNKSLRQT